VLLVDKMAIPGQQMYFHIIPYYLHLCLNLLFLAGDWDSLVVNHPYFLSFGVC
jgi:hypothetical protein